MPDQKLRPGEALKPCPFCGNTELRLWNTHTACYVVECPCGAAVTGAAFGSSLHSQDLRPRHHKLGRNSAIYAWNRRVPT